MHERDDAACEYENKRNDAEDAYAIEADENICFSTEVSRQ
jgi:hypothetical protein